MVRDRYLAVLGLNSYATKSDVAQAYHDLVQVWHPDRFRHDPRLKQLAEDKTKDLDAAYNYLKNDTWIRDSGESSARSSFEKNDQQRTAYTHSFSSNVTPNWRDFFPTGAQLLNLLVIAVLTGSILGAYQVSQNNSSALADALSKKKHFGNPHRSDRGYYLADNQSSELPNTVYGSDTTPGEQTPEREDRIQLSFDVLETTPVSFTPEAETPIQIETAPTVDVEGNIKSRDKLYVIGKSRTATEMIINQTPDLVDASIDCKVDQVKHMLQAGADPNQIDARGETALIWAVKRRCLAVVELLLKNGANLEHASNNGFTAYVWARVYGNRQMADLLANRGADTAKGGYWWRNDPDQKPAWIERTAKYLCKPGQCS